MTNSTIHKDGNSAFARAFQDHRAQDCVFLAFIVLLSCLFYISRLGFYWDDWHILKIFHFSAEQSLIGLTRSLFTEWPEMKARPIQGIQWAVLYKLFGSEPLGYHVANTATLFAGLCLCYIAVRALTGWRLLSIAMTVLYGTLPHYSTDRFWSAILAANLSMAFYFMSLYGDLKQAENRESWIGGWKAVALVSLIISTLAYELFLPFFLLNPLLIAFKRWQMNPTGSSRRWSLPGGAAFYLANPVFLGAISVFKGRTTTRAPGSGEYGWWLVDNVRTGGFDLTFGAYGLNLPHILGAIGHNYWNWISFTIAVMLAAAATGYLLHVGASSRERMPRAAVLAVSALAGTVLAGGSYAYLYSFYQVNSGVNNRVTLAASVVVALVWVSLAALFSRALPARVGEIFFCVKIGVLCGIGCLINNTVSEFWVGASEDQQEILMQMKEDLPVVSPGSAVMLVGFCAWRGPGIVFEDDWDTTGAIALLYEDESIKADVLRLWTEVTSMDIRLSDNIHPFESLYVYDVGNRTAHRISDQAAAEQWIERAIEDDANRCLSGGYGTGLPIW